MRIENLGVVAVIGAGTMGSDIALLFAIAGFDVMVSEVSEEARKALRRKNEQALRELVNVEELREDPEKVMGRIGTTKDLKDVEDASFVLEAITEDLGAKRKLFKELENIVSDKTVLATNTSSYRVTEITEGMVKPERVGGMHFSNPPITMPLVEVVKGEKTSEGTLAFIDGMAKKIGKSPVTLRRDVRGFVLNNVLLATMMEGLWAIDRGEVTPQELDAAIHSIGMSIGIAEGIDLIGIDVALLVGNNFREVYGERIEPPPSLLKMIFEEGKLGKKSGIGFYDWRHEPPKVDPNLAGKYDTTRTMALAADAAFRLIQDRVADPETIDKVVELGVMAPAGPCKMADELGLDFLLETMEKCYEKFGLKLYSPCPLFKEYVERGWTGRAAGRGFYKY